MSPGEIPPAPPASAGPPPEGEAPDTSSLGVVGLFVCVVLVAGALSAGVLLSGRQNSRSTPQFTPPRPLELAGFSLVDRTGRRVERSEVAGKYVVVNFVFTSCGASCLQISRRMAEIERALAGAPDVQLLSITVDPRTDTPAVLDRFAAQLGAKDTNRWLFLTGDQTEVFHLIDTSLLPGFDSPTGDPFASIEGSTRIGLLDPRGRVIGYFDGFNPRTPDSVVRTIDRMRKEGSR